MKQYLSFLTFIILILSCNSFQKKNDKKSSSLLYENEIHFKNLRQLTFGGEKRRGLLEFRRF